MSVRITSIRFESIGPEALDRDMVQIVTKAAGDGVVFTLSIHADEVADPELLEAYQRVFDTVVARIPEQTARAWAVSP